MSSDRSAPEGSSTGGSARWPHPGPLRTVDQFGAPDLEHFPTDRPLTVVVWNTGKATGAHVHELYDRLLTGEAGRPAGDLFLLQEARPEPLEDLPGIAHHAHSWRGRRGVANGVLTYSRCAPSEPPHNLPSPHREFAWTSHKNGLIATYPLADGRTLCTANVHGVNFRATPRPLREQLNVLRAELAAHDGPLLLGGDFNTWQRGRLSALLQTARALGLTRIRPREGSGTTANGLTKRAIGRPFSLKHDLHLDHLFARGFVPALPDLPPRWCPELSVSDHVPLVAHLRLV